MFYWIKQMNRITGACKPESVGTRGTAYVQDRCRRRRQVSEQNILGTCSLQLAGAVEESAGLSSLPIVVEHLCRE
jgi:hypothetical protein